MKAGGFATEAELVAAYCAAVTHQDVERWRLDSGRLPWTAYHETAGWDLLMVNGNGTQVGIEAKLVLNAKVLDQALDGHWFQKNGPDFRAVLVPRIGLQHHLDNLARHLGITIITAGSGSRFGDHFTPDLPTETSSYVREHWHPWFPTERCRLPDYIPDVTGGKAAPLRLSEWKIKAIRLMVLLDRRGFVTRADMRQLQISPTRWTAAYHGFLAPDGAGGYVRCDRTPNFRGEHPKNYAQIEADFEKWAPALPKAD